MVHREDQHTHQTVAQMFNVECARGDITANLSGQPSKG